MCAPGQLASHSERVASGNSAVIKYSRLLGSITQFTEQSLADDHARSQVWPRPAEEQ